MVSTHLCNKAAKRRDSARDLLESLREFMRSEGTDTNGRSNEFNQGMLRLHRPPGHRSSVERAQTWVPRAHPRTG